MGDFNPQEFANTAWAFATVGQSDVQLFVPLARAVEQHLGNFNQQTIANTADRLKAFKGHVKVCECVSNVLNVLYGLVSNLRTYLDIKVFNQIM